MDAIMLSGDSGGCVMSDWDRKLNQTHHCYPNMINVDVDIDTSPMLLHKVSNIWIYKFQHLYHYILNYYDWIAFSMTIFLEDYSLSRVDHWPNCCILH